MRGPPPLRLTPLSIWALGSEGGEGECRIVLPDFFVEMFGLLYRSKETSECVGLGWEWGQLNSPVTVTRSKQRADINAASFLDVLGDPVQGAAILAGTIFVQDPVWQRAQHRTVGRQGSSATRGESPTTGGWRGRRIVGGSTFQTSLTRQNIPPPGGNGPDSRGTGEKKTCALGMPLRGCGRGPTNSFSEPHNQKVFPGAPTRLNTSDPAGFRTFLLTDCGTTHDDAAGYRYVGTSGDKPPRQPDET